MSPKKLCITLPYAALACLLVAGPLAADVRAADDLSRSDFYRYRTWTRLNDELEDVDGQVPYPGLSIAAAGDTLDLRDDLLKTAALSLLALEDHLVREWERTRYYTADRNLRVARSYRDVGEYGEALRWYRKAVQGPESHRIRGPELRHEMFAVAVLSADSLLVTEELLNLLGQSDLSDEGASLELAFRWLLATDDTTNLDHAMAKIGGDLDHLGHRVVFWHAFVQAARDQRDGCFASLEKLLARDGAPASLSRAERCWVLRTYADLYYLDGRREDALRLYTLLAESPRPDPGDWGRFQLANHRFLSGEYVAAGELYASFCDEASAGDWRERACAMAADAELLERIREEGTTYGTDVIHRR